MFKIIMSTLVLCLASGSAVYAASSLDADIRELQTAWAIAKYKTPEDKQDAAFEKLTTRAAEIAKQHNGKAEVLIWQAIIVSTHAGVSGGFGALSKVGDARDLLVKAEAIDANALNGSIYTSLGSLYYQVPGWPLGFGDDDKAAEYLKKALQLNPDGIDPNFFYADYLIEEGENKQAVKYLEKAIAAPDRPARPVADAGRRAEARAMLAKIKKNLAASEY